MTIENESPGQDKSAEPAFGDRLRFAMWLSAMQLGTWNAKEFAAAVGRQETQISRWAREDPKPGWDVIKDLAVRVRISPTWLDDPSTPGAMPPEMFDQWLDARRRFVAQRNAEQAPRRSAKLEEPDVPAARTSVKRSATGRKRA
jgi:hypothetical protein